MTDLPDLKIKTIPHFPSSVVGGDGIDIDNAAGQYTIDLDHGDFATSETIPSSPTSTVLAYDTATGVYANVPISLFGGSSVSGAVDYPTKAAVEAYSIPASISYLQTGGYYAAGDGGAALYKKVGSAPSHAGKMQSLDGAWWEIAESIIDVRMLGAVCDNTANDGPAINAALLIPQRVILIPAGKACRTAETINIQGDIGTTLMGGDFDSGNYPTFTSSRIHGDAALPIIVHFNGLDNAATTLRNIIISRAGGVPPAGSIGLCIQDSYNSILSHVYVWNNDINFSIRGQIYNLAAGLGLMGTHLFSVGAADVHFLMDSYAEVRLHQCRFGSNNYLADYSCNAHFRAQGGHDSTAGGPNTLVVTNSQFNQSVNKVKHIVEFVNRGVGNIDTSGFTFQNCHFEGLATAANGGSGIYSDATWIYLLNFFMSNCTFNNTSTPVMALNPATNINGCKLLGNTFFTSGLTFAPASQTLGLVIANNWIGGAFTLTPGSANNYATVADNQISAPYTVTGAWTEFLSAGNAHITGARNVTPTGAVTLADVGYTLKHAHAGGPPLQINRTSDASPIQVAIFEGSRATPTASDSIYISYQLANSVGAQTEAVRVNYRLSNITSGAENAQLFWSLRQAGVLTDKVLMTTLSFTPSTNDGMSLGAPIANNWSDLFLASGAVINFNNGDVVLTHAADVLTMTGGKFTKSASTTAYASFNIPTGAAPTTPVDGDIWREDNTNTGLKVRINGVTKTITVV